MPNKEKFIVKTFRITKKNDEWIKRMKKKYGGESQYLRELLTREKLGIRK